MKPLTNRQRAYLRGLGQALRPQLRLGHAGHTPAVTAALEELLRSRELVKVRVLKTGAEPAREVADALAAAASAALVGVVGQTFVLYRPNPELKERIELPAETAAPPRRPRRPA